MKFYDFIVERGSRVTLKQIDAPPTQWKTPLALFEAAYRHEVKVTGMINKLVDLAIKEKDHATNNFLQWFVEEQVEEEASADEMVRRLKLIGRDGRGLYMLDKEIGARPPLFTFPANE